jgi:crotonobetainyl-CoA:carnitine CoA-transferase CaiB-like acyl-CoA transferase
MTQRVDLGGPATGPLNGVRIIDFTAVYSGPIAASILGDQGAEVIKVESKAGDLMRRGLPVNNGMGGAFTTMNRNKKSLCLDLQTDAGRDIARKLIATADVVMENFRPGVMDRLGLGYAEFKDTQPKLVYASINGVGSTGPYSNRRVYDAVIQAISGFTTLQADGDPAMVNSLVCDKITSLTAAEAVVAALFQAERSGRGQRVELSMLDASLFFLWPDVMTNYTFLDGEVEEVPRSDHSVFLRKTKDGWIASMPVQQAEVLGAFRALGVEHLITDERFSSFQNRARNRALLRELMDDAYARFTTDELCDRFEAEDVPYSRINLRHEITDDPQVQAMQALWTYDHPQAGAVRTPRPPAQFADTPSNIYAHTPTLGEHNSAILTELGFSVAQIEALTAKRVIFAEELAGS